MTRGLRITVVAVALVLALVAGSSQRVYAHGFGPRYDLPVPLWLYLAGAGAAVALSFVIVGVFVRGTFGLQDYPRLNLLRWRTGRVLVHPAILVSVKAVSLGLFGLVVVAGLVGVGLPVKNLAPTMVWVIWWVGMAYVSALVGNLWALINPWKIAFELAETLNRRLYLGRELSLGLPYMERAGVWPGFLLFLGFAWAEIVYADSAVPLRIAQMALIYSAITWGGMLLFGKEVWLQHGEAFSLAFGFLARFAPTEVRVTDARGCALCEVPCRDLDGHCVGCVACFRKAAALHRELNLRPFAVGLLRNESASPSMMAFVLLFLSTVTFDGFTATPAWASIFTSLNSMFPNATAVGTLGLGAFPVLFIGVYLGFTALMATASGHQLPVGDMARAFVYSLVPIALAYHLAHFLSFLILQGQLLIPLVSDPFGFGWDLLGTADYKVNIAVVNARFAWFTAVAAIVAGHIIAVYLAHAIALRTLRQHRPALRSQYPMLALMVGYTMLSLWILAQPIVETGARN